MVNMTFAKEMCEIFEKFKEAVAAAAEAMKKMYDSIKNIP